MFTNIVGAMCKVFVTVSHGLKHWKATALQHLSLTPNTLGMLIEQINEHKISINYNFKGSNLKEYKV